jgi:regulator of RNase E activity RraB
MGLFDFLNKDGEVQHVPEKTFEENIAAQTHLAPIALNIIHDYHDDEEELSMEFFFYTNTTTKASELTNALEKLNYTVYDNQLPGGKEQIAITGCTPSMKMSNDVVTEWVGKMCELGYIFDGEFDGWGTIFHL